MGKRLPTAHELEFAARQRVNCRCGVCGELLAENVSIRESVRLIEKHRSEVHGLGAVPDQQAGNRARREAADQHVLDALGKRWTTIRDLSAKAGIEQMALRRRLDRLVIEGRALKHTSDDAAATFRCA